MYHTCDQQFGGFPHFKNCLTARFRNSDPIIQTRRVKMVYKTNGVTTFTRRFIWCGAQPCWESANVTGQPGMVKRYFAQGVLEGSDKYFYLRDHLGSVREVMKNNSSTVEARYDYDPWGRQTQTTGTRVFDIGYAGYMVFAPTGTNIKLNLTWYRAYSPELGRWLSRDPLEEKGGRNLYRYVSNRPVISMDPLGLLDCVIVSGLVGAMIGSLVGTVIGGLAGGAGGVVVGTAGGPPGILLGGFGGAAWGAAELGFLGSGAGALAGVAIGTLICNPDRAIPKERCDPEVDLERRCRKRYDDCIKNFSGDFFDFNKMKECVAAYEKCKDEGFDDIEWPDDEDVVTPTIQ